MSMTVKRAAPYAARAVGFTIVELLVVIVVIALLSAMIVAGASALGVSSKKRKTETILAALRQGIELAAAGKGSVLAPVEHPLAGSRPGRLVFAGLRDRAADGTGGAWVATLDATGEALTGAPEWQVQAPHNRRVLMDDDRFADTDVPMLYGAERRVLRVLGAEMAASTWYRRLPTAKPGEAALPQPYDGANPRYADELCLVRGRGAAIDNKRALDYLFGGGTVLSELAALKAVYAPPDDDAPKRISPPTPVAGMDGDGRVWSPDGRDPSDGLARWEPGRMRDGLIDAGPDSGSPDWKRYRLRGLGFYDAWNREILVSQTAAGGVRLLSAGPDGVLCWAPGGNLTIDTPADANAPAGDDKDGARDNVEISR